MAVRVPRHRRSSQGRKGNHHYTALRTTTSPCFEPHPDLTNRIYRESAVVLNVHVSRVDGRLDVPHALDRGISALHWLLEFSHLSA